MEKGTRLNMRNICIFVFQSVTRSQIDAFFCWFLQEKEMFFYGGLMGVVAIIFGVMSYFYKYVTLEELQVEKDEEKENLDVDGIPLEERSSEDNSKV